MDQLVDSGVADGDLRDGPPASNNITPVGKQGQLTYPTTVNVKI